MVIMCLLIALILVLLYPTVPHEVGWDSFGVHMEANSISEFGYARWWIHPASVIGSYPYSAPSAVPFILSGISQCTSVNMMSVILLYSIILGVFSIFAAYLMAGVIWNNDFFKFLVSFVFSTSQGIVTFSYWTANARTLYIILLPLFIYLLLKIHTKIKYCILTSILFALLLVTHHYIYFTIPLIISFLIIAISYKLGKHIKSIKIPENYANWAMFSIFLIMFSLPFFTRTLAEADPEGMSGGRYAWMRYMILSYIRYIGFIIVLVVSGYIYLVFKRNKRLEEWFLLLSLASLAPFLYIITYMKWYIIPFYSLLIGIALVNVAMANIRSQNRIIIPSLMVIIVLLLSICFTGYYQYLHFLNEPNPDKRYMEERTYVGALWIKDNINKDNNMVAGPHMSYRLPSVSEVPTLTGIGTPDLAYGFQDPQKLEVKQIYPFTSTEFYMHDPYRAVNHSFTDWHLVRIWDSDINNLGSYKDRFSSFNFSYYAENMDASTMFTQSVQETKECLYDNGKLRVWDLV